MPLVAFLLLCHPALSATAGLRLDVEVGFAGFLVPGVWTPVRVNITAPSSLDGMLVIDVPDVHGTRTPYRYPLHLLAGTRQEIRADVVVPDPRVPLIVRVVGGEREIERREVLLSGARTVDGVVVALARDVAGLEFITSLSGRLRPAYIHADTLPVRWQSYEGVTAVVIRDLEETQVLAAQRQALREWVAQGGRLVVTGSDLLVNAKGSWLESLLPAIPVGSSEVPASAVLPGVRASLSVAVVTPRPGATTVLADGTIPLIVQGRYGRGRVTLWAFDAFSPTLRGRPTLRAMWREVLTSAQPGSVASRTLAEALPSAPSLPGAVQAQIALFLVLYIVALRWTLRRLGAVRHGWLGATAVVVAFGALLYGSAVTARRSATSMFQISLAEVIPDVGVARVTTYAALIAPYGGSFQLMAPVDATIRPFGGSALNVFGTAGQIAGQAPPDAIRFELVQVLPMAVRGLMTMGGEGLHIEIENQSGLVIREPIISLNGQIYILPEIRTHLSAVLDPAKWEPFDPQRVHTDDLARRVRHWALGRLGPDVIIRRDRAFLIGWVDDARLAVRSQVQRGSAVHLLVMPLGMR